MMLSCVVANDQIGHGSPIINSTPIANESSLPANKPFYIHNDTQLIIESSHAFKNISHTITRNKIQFPFDPIIPQHPIIFNLNIKNVKFNPANNNSRINAPDQPNTKNLSVKYSFKTNYGFKPSVQFPFAPTLPDPIIFNLTNHKNLKLVCNLGNSNNNPIILQNNVSDQPNLDVIHSFKTTKYHTNYSQIEVHIYNQTFYDNDSFTLEVKVDNKTQDTYTLYDNKNPYQTAKVEYQPLNPGKHNISVCLEKSSLQIKKGYNMYHNFDFNIRSIPIEPEYTWQLNTTFTIPSE